MGALGDNYATKEQLKDRLAITTTTHDARLEMALKTASRGIDKFCGRQFNTALSETARRFHPSSPAVCRVDDFQSLTSLKTDESDTGTFGLSWSAADYEVTPLNGIVDGEPGWPFWRIGAVGMGKRFRCWRRASVEVTALWGWAAVPAAVTEACLVSAEEIFKLRDTPFGVGGYGDFGVIRVRENPFTSRMLGPYRRNPVLVA